MPNVYSARKERLTLIDAVVGGPEAFTEAWLAPHAKVGAIRARWPISDYDARAYAVSLGLGTRPGRIVAIETATEAATPDDTGITIPAASVDRLVDALAEAVAARVYDLLEERLNRKARRGLFGTGR
jgi:hypothetical protein